MIKICITGGPSGGKTTLIEALEKDLSDKICFIPEAASILYRGGFPRHNHPIGKKHAQRAIYYTQKELEALISEENANKHIVCDRGSLDSIAYWPGTATDYFESLQTNPQKEYSRYDWVIHMDTAAHNGFETHNNPVRIESHHEAIELNKKIKEAWSGHSQRLIIKHQEDFILKLAQGRKAIAMILAGSHVAEIQKAIENVSI